MNSAILLALVGMLAVANAGLIAAPAVGVAPVAYAGYPGLYGYGNYGYGYAAAHTVPLTYAAAVPHVVAAIPATIHTRTYHGNGAPVFAPAAHSVIVA